MTWHRATQADIPALQERLRANMAGAMFPLGNLNQHGLDGDAPRAMRFWLCDDSAFGLSNEGMAMPITPEDADWAGLLPALRGETFIGVIGATHAVHGLRAAAGLSDAPTTLDKDEPGFRLLLNDLVLPECTGLTLSPITDALYGTVCAWRAAYDVETLGGAPDTAPANAEAAIRSYRANDSHRVLMRGDVPVAMTGFNACVDQTVQIGGVYTPPDLRCQGLARRAVALHLHEARTRGMTEALLFAASEQAAKAYRAIGFIRNGGFTLMLLAAPTRLP